MANYRKEENDYPADEEATSLPAKRSASSFIRDNWAFLLVGLLVVTVVSCTMFT